MADVLSPRHSSGSRVEEVEVRRVPCSRLCACPRGSICPSHRLPSSLSPTSCARQDRLNDELAHLVTDIWRVGDPTEPAAAFGALFDDEAMQQRYEGLAATLKAAKKSACAPPSPSAVGKSSPLWPSSPPPLIL